LIPKAEILSVAKNQELLANIVEKDYVIGRFLMGIAQHPLLNKLVFKGGTCLKKCFFETYRFSEDLDFTVPEGSVYDAYSYREALIECTDSITEETGIQFPEEGIEIKESHDKENRRTFQGKVSYRGPLQPRSKTLPKIKIDLSKHEVIVEPPEQRNIQHFYSDRPANLFPALCYSINEILAEKTRAIYERAGRARDIYDIVNIGRNYREDINPQRALTILREKFKFKSLPIPTVENILAKIDDQIIRANWEHQLRHQLPVLPPVQSYLEELRSESLWWMEVKPIIVSLPSISEKPREKSIPRMPFPEMGHLGIQARTDRDYGTVSYSRNLDLITYAARNRLCVEIGYHGVDRLVEPYSLRIKNTGHLLLYVHEQRRGYVHSGTIKAFKLAEIEYARVTEKSYSARYLVEL